MFSEFIETKRWHRIGLYAFKLWAQSSEGPVQ